MAPLWRRIRGTSYLHAARVANVDVHKEMPLSDHNPTGMAWGHPLQPPLGGAARCQLACSEELANLVFIPSARDHGHRQHQLQRSSWRHRSGRAFLESPERRLGWSSPPSVMSNHRPLMGGLPDLLQNSDKRIPPSPGEPRSRQTWP